MDAPNSSGSWASAQGPDWQQLRQILATSKTIAVVGISDDPSRPSHTVPAYLKAQGYRIIPVNPTITEALGEKSYASLRDLPEPVDVVLVFRRPADVPPVVDDAIANGAKTIWMQSGIRHDAAAARAEAAGIQVVMDTCMRTTHRTLSAGGEL